MKKDKKHISGSIIGKFKDKKDIIQFKDFVPSNIIDSIIPQKPLKKFVIQNFEQYKAEHIPNNLVEEWDNNKTPEELNKEIEENLPENTNIFQDEDHLIINSNLPFSLILQTENNIEWKRPNEYVLNYYLDHKIQILYPKKNYIATRENMKQYHIKLLRENALKAEMNKNKENNELEEEDEEEDNIDMFLKDDEEMRKMNMYKELLSILSKEYDYKIVNTEKIIENDEQIIEKKEKEKEENIKSKRRKDAKKVSLENKKNDLEKEKTDNNNEEESEKKYTLIPKPSNIYLQNFLKDGSLHNSFYSWLSSVYQLIIDLKIPDIETGKSIFSNIYPQRDGIPYYNPKGKYIIKMYQHGKPRKIIIDDRMPCNRNFEYILPQCENVEELWPAIFLKGLLKLNIYKNRHPSYYYNEEFMDANIIYSLTGMQVITLDLNIKLLEIFKNKFNISEENGKKKMEKKFFALYNKYKTKRMNLNRSKSYFDIQTEYDFKNQIKGTYINNFNLQGKNIVPFQKGEKIFLKARERSSSIIERNLLNFGMNFAQKTFNKQNNKKEKEKDKPNNFIFNEENKDNQEKDGKQKINTIKINKKFKFQRGTNKKQTTIIKDNPVPTGELKRKNKNIELIDQNNNLIYNYLYSVDDFFCNENFNMSRLHFLDFSDLQKEIRDKKVEFKRLPTEQKKQYLIDRKKLKIEKFEEKKRRIKALKENGLNYNLIHIVNEANGLPKLNYLQEYSSEQVELAKKCLLNRWEFPPPSYFEKEFLLASEEQKKLKKLKTLEDKVIPKKRKKEKINNDKPVGLFSWTREMYEELIGGKEVLNMYKTNVKIPKKSKIEGGGWMAFEDVCKRFNKLIIIQNTKYCYKESLYVDNTWNNYKVDEFHPSEDNAIFLLVKTPVEEFSSGDDDKNDGIGKKKLAKKKENNKNKKNEEEKNETDISIISEPKNNNLYSSLLVVFEPLNEEFLLNKKINEIFYSYISIDLFEKDTNIQIKKNIILKNFYSVFYYPYLQKEKDYYIKINSGLTPFGYNLQIFSDFYKIQHISKNSFLKYFQGFQEYNLITQTQYPIEKDKNYMLAKISFSIPDLENINKIKFKIDIKHEFYFLLKYINIFLVRDNPYYKKEIETEKIFSFEEKNTFFYNNKISPNEEYYFIFYIKPGFDIPETEFNIKILYNNPNINFKEIINLEPFELTDIYYKNKDSILFSYFIYPSEKIYVSMDINFYHFKLNDKTNIDNAKNSSQNNAIASNEKLQNIDKYEKCMLGKDENHHINLEIYQLTKEPSLDFIDNAMKFSYSNQGELIKQWKFTNSLSISNFIFIGDILPDLKKKKNPGNKNDKNANDNESDENKKLYPYVLLCYVDVQKVSDLNIPNDFGYTIRIYSSNSIAFIKDKTKEEHEKKLKEKWEENDEGRGKLAIKSRKKFLVFAKNLKKEKLNENELKILNEERQRRTANEIEHIIDENEVKNNNNSNIKIKKIKNSTIKQIDNIKDKLKSGGGANKNRNSCPNINEEESSSTNNIFSRNIINYINKRARPISMENIIRQKRPISRSSKSEYILNFLNYSEKERTIYAKKLEKMPLLRNKSFFRNKNIIISDEKYRETIKNKIMTIFEESKKELKKDNEIYMKATNDLAEGINNYNKNLNNQRRAQSLCKDSLLNRRRKLQGLIQKRLDIKREILFYNDENKKILDNLEVNKKELNNKKGDLINYDELIRIYKEGSIFLGNKDNDLNTFFNLVSNIKEEEIKFEYEKIKNTNDKNKDNIISKIIEDIEINKWNINSELIEKLKKEIEIKNNN